MLIQELITTSFNQEFTQSIALGILLASAFPIGAALATTRKFPRRVKGNLAAVAAGIYFSTLAFSLVEEGIKVSSFPPRATGFAIGAVIFSIAHPIVKKRSVLTKVFSLSYSSQKKEEEKPENVDINGSRSENKKMGNSKDQIILLFLLLRVK